jgi:hypothetical protein
LPERIVQSDRTATSADRVFCLENSNLSLILALYFYKIVWVLTDATDFPQDAGTTWPATE